MLKHKAFTMLELIFVIVIMGILAKFGVEFIAQAYKSFIFSKINNNLQSNSSSAVELIASRLQYRIKASVVATNPATGTSSLLSNSADDNATILEWVGSLSEGFRGSTTTTQIIPDWSGILDINDSNSSVLVSPKTNTNTVNNLIVSLSNGTNSMNSAALYFIGSTNISTGWGWNTGTALADQNGSIHPVKAGTNTNEFVSSIVGKNFSGVDVYEYYKLAWTAYAVGIDDWNSSSKTGTLKLWYDYRPWLGQKYSDLTTKSALIAENVSAFRFRASGSLIKIQVCSKSSIPSEEYSICKEKTIY